MMVDKPLFIRSIFQKDLELTMNQAKEKFPNIQIIFVILYRKGDPNYGKNKTTI